MEIETNSVNYPNILMCIITLCVCDCGFFVGWIKGTGIMSAGAETQSAQWNKIRNLDEIQLYCNNNDVNKIGPTVGLLQVVFIKYHGSDLRYEIRSGAVIRALKVKVVERSIIDVRPLLDVSNKTFAW